MNNRQIELKDSMKAFSKEKYSKDELLSELFCFQQEIVNLAFAENHAEKMKLKMYDVQRHLHEKNEELNNIVEGKLLVFDEYCEKFNTMIGREIAGRTGEKHLFRTLETIEGENIILQNIELHDGENKAELDAVVIAPGAIFLLEVKNSSHDMIIDSRGNYYRTRGYMNFDYNIGEKVNNKEYLLRQAVNEYFTADNSKELKIVSAVVFANSKMHCDNRNKYIKTCYLSSLPYFIKEQQVGKMYSAEQMKTMADLIKKAEKKERYAVDFDFEGFKNIIADILATLEAEVDKTQEKKDNCNQLRTYKVKKQRKLTQIGLATGCALFAVGMTIGCVCKRV